MKYLRQRVLMTLLIAICRQRYLVVLSIIFISIPTFCIPQVLTKSPYLIEPGYTKMIIRWETDAATKCSLHYGRDGRLTREKQANLRAEKGGGYLYEVVLDSLKSEAHYSYQVSFGGKKSPIAHFTTFAKKQSTIHFVAMGDSRSNPDIFADIINSMQMDEPDLIISMGDLVAYGGSLAEWNRFYFDVAKNLIDHIPLVSTLGDHEGDDDEGELFRHFCRTDQPTEKLWFSFDYGDAHFVSLDYRHPNSDEMVDWFVRDMSASNARWNFVYFHRPCYNLGGHRSTWGRDIWPALFREYRVDIVFAGHSHQYERFYPMRPKQESDGWPVTYVTTGGAGAGLYEVMQHEALAVAESVNHFVDILIIGDTLKFKAIRRDGTLMDEFSISKKGKGHDPAYLEMVQPQERIDLLTGLASAVSLTLEYVPFERYAAPCTLTLKSCMHEELPFRIELTDESTQFYRMEAVSGVLGAQEEMEVLLSIFSNVDTITISGWGRINPELRLKLTYNYDLREETIVSGRAEYWPSVY